MKITVRLKNSQSTFVDFNAATYRVTNDSAVLIVEEEIGPTHYFSPHEWLEVIVETTRR